MGKAIVNVEIPVSPEAASRLQDEVVRQRAGAFLEAVFGPGDPRRDELLDLMDAVGRRAEQAGLTEADIEAELAAYNAERRV